MLCNPSPTEILSTALQTLNAPSPMKRTESGIEIEGREVQ